MITSQQTSLINDALSDQPFAPDDLGYVLGLVRNRAHSCVLEKFVEAQDQHGLTKARIARKLNKRPEVVSRELTAPGNWTLDTYGSYLFAMGYLPCFYAQDLRGPLPRPSQIHPLSDDITLSPSAQSTSSVTTSSVNLTGATATGATAASVEYVVTSHGR
jgi:hypothetical protein